MGIYINPTEMTKEQFLYANGFPIAQSEARDALVPGQTYPVCLVSNGAFTAAGVAYSLAEVEAFSLPHDKRPKQWYIVAFEDLKPYIKGTELEKQYGSAD